ncbi:MAG: PDC sensor domain-containing protein, partial [Actinomycetota bacterium]
MSALIARARRVLGAQRSGRPGIGRALIGFVLLCSIVAPVWFMADDRLRERRVAEQVGKVEQFRDQQLAVVDGWVSDLLTDARFWAGDATIVESTQRLLGQRGAELLSSSALATIRARLGAFLELNELSGFFVIAPDGTSLASSRNGNIGTPNLVAQDHPEVFAAVLAGETLVTPVQPTDVPISDELRDVETFFVAAPIVDRGAVIAVLTLRVVPQLDLPSVKARSATFEGFSWVVFSADGTATTGAGEIEPLDELFFGGTPASTVLVDRPVGTNVDDGDRDVVDRIEAWAVSDQIGLGVVAVQDGDDAFAPLQSERRGFALVALSILAVGGVLVVVAQLAWSRYRSREELETTRQRVRDLIDPSPDAIFRLRRDGVVLGANETADALAGGAAR